MNGKTPLTEGEVQARIERVRPFFEYCEAHAISPMRLMTRVCMRRGEKPWSRQRLHSMKRGLCLTPDWFVSEMCAQIGRPVAEIMGADWTRERAGVSGRDPSVKAG